MDLMDVLREFDAKIIQPVPCPACSMQAGWDWQATDDEASMTCRNCGVKQIAEPIG